MQSMTIEQLRAANDAGGVEGVILKGQGGAFFVQITTRSGPVVLLAKARSSEPRRFGNPIAALNVLRDVGITTGRFDSSEWHPDDKQETPGNRGRAEAMRKAHHITSSVGSGLPLPMHMESQVRVSIATGSGRRRDLQQSL